MEIADKIYGTYKVSEPILMELINSKPLQRLKGISQFGFPDEYYHKKTFSRYEHSIGVFLLVKKLDADLEEQVSALLHDVSHTSFSHVIDWFLGDPTKEDYQDKTHTNFIKNSELPFILDKHGLDYAKICGQKNFSLLEREAPSLCADRIDYSLREMNYNGKNNLVKRTLANLKNVGGQIAFTNVALAEIFAREYMHLQKEHWAGNQARARYYLMAKALKRAVKNNFISMEDFMQTDNYVLNRLYLSGDKEILKYLHSLKTGLNIKKSKNGIELKKKFRYVDPEVFLNGKIISLSEISKKYKEFIEAEKQNSISFARVLIK